MAQVTGLVEALKSLLKAANIRYAAVATALGLSESSVKRKFSRQEFSLLELDQICALAGTEISELVRVMEQKQGRLQHLSTDQEREIAAHLGLLIVAVCVLNRWSFEEILAFYVFEEHELVRMLATLDRLHLIELQPNNRIKLLVAPNFGWLPNGPIETVFLQVIQRDFFATRFDREQHQLIVLNGMLTDDSNAEFRRKMERLSQEFDLLNQEDTRRAFADRHGYTVVLAVRDWRYAGFRPYRRTTEEGDLLS